MIKLHTIARRLLLACVLTGAGLFLQACGPNLSDGVGFESDLVYGKGYFRQRDGDFELQDLYLDVIFPEDAPGNQPAVCMVHGGGFTGGSREDEELVALADRLASAGYVCFLIDYRLAGEPPPAPPPYDDLEIPLFGLDELVPAAHAAFVDTKVALRHIRANADRYGIDPRRIAVFGESAGAFAALAAGVSDPEDFFNDGMGYPVPPENNLSVNPKPQAVIDFWGSASFVLDEFDPSDPPIMIVHGVLDTQPGTFYINALNIRDACVENNIPYTFYTLPFEGHGAWEATVNDKDLATLALEFLETHL
jgi:hypothetical protein